MRRIDPLEPARAALPAGRRGLFAVGLTVPEASGWIGARCITDGSRLPELLASVGRRLRAAPHVAAALAWKTYTYALAVPVVAGWASARRVPLVGPADVLIRFDTPGTLLTLGLRPSIRVAVLATDPIAALDVDVVRDEAALLDVLRRSLLDEHLGPLLGHIRTAARVGSRTLLGSLASGVAHAVIDTAGALPGSPADRARELLTALRVQHLVDLVPQPGGALTVQRRTCCLAIVLPEPKVCGGCCVRRARPAVAHSRDATGDRAHA